MKDSLPFRLLFIGSLLSKNFAIPISVDCGCKSTPFFYTRNTFLKIFLNYFFKAVNQRVAYEILEDKAEKRTFETQFRSPISALSGKILRQINDKTLKSD